MAFDTNRPYGSVCGQHGAVYEQDGRFYTADGQDVTEAPADDSAVIVPTGQETGDSASGEPAETAPKRGRKKAAEPAETALSGVQDSQLAAQLGESEGQ